MLAYQGLKMAALFICSSFYKTGQCGTAGCPYMHVKASSEKASAPANKQLHKQHATAPTSKQPHKKKAAASETTLPPKKSIPCTFYKGGEGHCKNGDSCKFSHAKPVVKPVAPKDHPSKQLEELVQKVTLQLKKLDAALLSVHK